MYMYNTNIYIVCFLWLVMVNAPRMHQERRAKHVAQIQASIEKQIKKKKNIDIDSIVLSTMANLNLSRRTAMDYVFVSFYNLGIDNPKKHKK